MVEIQIEYQGELRCEATHVPSGTLLSTDAPTDNRGKGESFSPTDLLATSLGACIATTIAIKAQDHGWELEGTRVRVEKVMVADPVRRIGRLEVDIFMPRPFDKRARVTMEKVAHTCPVHRSLHEGVEVPIRFHWVED